MTSWLRGVVMTAAVLGFTASADAQWLAQTPAPAPAPAEKAADKPEEKPKTLWEEIALFAYIENSYVWNLGHTGRGDVNELRLYDFDAGYSFNMAEFSIKKDPTDRRPWGFGVVVTGGLDAQKNHAIGIFRDDDDAFPFRNTFRFDLQEAYGSYKFDVGSGLTLKAGKFVTLLGSEVIESPNNLNFSRSYLFSFAIPLTHVGALLSYAPVEWLSITAGPVVGWDVANDNNDTLSVIGQIAFTGVKDLTTALNFITGPEQFDQKGNPRTVLDLTASYTGIKNLTLGANLDYGWEVDEPSLISTRSSSTTARWYGVAGYVAYDWTEQLRTAFRGEYFRDADGARTLALGAGQSVSLWEITATLQYKIWKGLVGRLEFRHDQADEKAFKVRAPGLVPTSKSQDTITVALHYLFF
jgi:Putative beta-barrel porin-2, OmpL-like. bbp2